MKKFTIFLIGLIAVFGLSAFAATKSSQLVVKQTITFEDDSKVEIYYVKADGKYRVFSETNLEKESFQRLLNTKSSNFEKASSYKGKCYYEAKTLQEVYKTFDRLAQKYARFLPLE